MKREPSNTHENYIKRKEWAVEILKELKGYVPKEVFLTAIDIAIAELEISITNQ